LFLLTSGTSLKVGLTLWQLPADAHRCNCKVVLYRVFQKCDTLLVSEFSTLVRCIIFAIFVYLHIIFIKCLISEPSVVSIDGLSSMDGAPSHTAKNTTNYLKTENVSFIKPQMWPPNSPDLNPVIDYAVWDALQQQV